jgi:predicted nucleotidyltransferase
VESRNRLEPDRILTALVKRHVEFVVIGAVAAIAHGGPLITQDLDITPAREPGNLDRLAKALKDLDARLRLPDDSSGIEFPIEPRFLGSVESWTLKTPSGDIDLLFVPSGTAGYEDLKRSAVSVELWGQDVLVASLEDIIRMKEAAARPKDLGQLPALRQTLELRRERDQS